jgi:ABC-type histidine transport system ATPase subunit
MLFGGVCMLDVIDRHKNFGALAVLKDISLFDSKGDVISILGRSGSGKSMFLRDINFLEIPTSDTIPLPFLATPTKKQSLALHTQTAMVFQ